MHENKLTISLSLTCSCVPNLSEWSHTMLTFFIQILRFVFDYFLSHKPTSHSYHACLISYFSYILIISVFLFHHDCPQSMMVYFVLQYLPEWLVSCLSVAFLHFIFVPYQNIGDFSEIMFYSSHSPVDYLLPQEYQATMSRLQGPSPFVSVGSPSGNYPTPSIFKCQQKSLPLDLHLHCLLCMGQQFFMSLTNFYSLLKEKIEYNLLNEILPDSPTLDQGFFAVFSCFHYLLLL